MRYRTLFHRVERLASDSIQYKGETHLGHLYYSCAGFTVDCYVRKGRLRRYVVVPNIVMNSLIVPDYLAVERI